jgi:6-phosphogluconolactonase (cycloisomerase 2 family)
MRRLVTTFAAAAAAMLTLPTLALGAPSTVYVTNYASPGAVSMFKIGTGGELTASGSVSAISDTNLMAFTPNGRYAYATGSGGAGGVSEYDVQPDGALVPMSVASVIAPGAYPIALSPNGKQVYVGEGSAVAIFNVGADGQLTPNPTQPTLADAAVPDGLALTPSGKSLYVANYSGGTDSGDVAQYSVAANGTLTADSTPAVSSGTNPQYISVTPNGKFAYVSNMGDGTVSQYRIGGDGTLTPIGSPVSAGASSAPVFYTVQVSPNGRSVYVPNTTAVYQFRVQSNGTLLAKSPASISAGTNIDDIWFAADGKSAYVPDFNDGNPGDVFEFNTSSAGLLSFKPTSTIASGEGPAGVMIAPDQAPIATFSVKRKGKGLVRVFNARHSRAPDGKVVRYHWRFGDGKITTTKSSSIKHRYRKARRYKVTLTVTDDAGCSTGFVYTGQSAYCHGGRSAIHTKKIKVARARA